MNRSCYFNPSRDAQQPTGSLKQTACFDKVSPGSEHAER